MKKVLFALFILVLNKAFSEEYLAITFQDKKSVPSLKLFKEGYPSTLLTQN